MDLNTLCNDALALWLDIAKVETGPAFRGNLKAWKLRAETESAGTRRRQEYEAHVNSLNAILDAKDAEPNNEEVKQQG